MRVLDGLNDFARMAVRALRAIAPAVALSLLVAACGSDGDDEIDYVERPVEDIYNQALDQLQAGEYRDAAREFDEVERQHPYSVWATKAQLMSAYSYYQNNDYEDALNALDRYIQLNPGSDEIAYAYYLRAICYYEQISDVGRDQQMTQRALEGLEEVRRRFPESSYARDAGLKIDLARDHLAGKNMEIGRWYLRHGEYLGAINRFQAVISDYQTTTHVPEALHRLVECYLALGVTDEAQATAAVLGHNFPGSDWYIDSYALLTGEDLRPEEKEGSWISSFF